VTRQTRVLVTKALVMKRLAVILILSLSAVLLAACPGGFGYVHVQPLTGPYRLVAVDSREDMMLCRGLGKSDCMGDGLPGPTIFAAGADARYLVIGRHPTKFGEPLNRADTEYYYAERSADEADLGSRPTVHGPFDRTQFDAEAGRLALPEFSVVFEDLK